MINLNNLRNIALMMKKYHWLAKGQKCYEFRTYAKINDKKYCMLKILSHDEILSLRDLEGSLIYIHKNVIYEFDRIANGESYRIVDEYMLQKYNKGREKVCNVCNGEGSISLNNQYVKSEDDEYIKCPKCNGTGLRVLTK